MKKVISQAAIKQMGLLANVKLTDEQAASLSKSISSVVGYMEEINTLDLENVPETAGVTEAINVLREDKVEPSLSQEEALRNAKRTYKGYFVVPSVFGEKKA